MNVLIPLIEKNKLHTSKYLDYLDFKACVTLIYKQGSVLENQDLDWVQNCIKGIVILVKILLYLKSIQVYLIALCQSLWSLICPI